MSNTNKIIDRIPVNWGKYIGTGKGWDSIIIKLDEELAKIDPNYEVHQVKEKFGGLRYYCSLDAHPEASQRIREAEKEASVTCEDCGALGTLRTGGWMRTLCDKCAGERA